MTCIFGVIDKKNERGIIAGDSAAACNRKTANEIVPKVWRVSNRPDILMGGTTTFRHLDLLRYSEDLFDKDAEVDHKYMVTKVVPRIIELFKKVASKVESDRGGNFLVVTSSHVFEVQEDYSVIENMSGVGACGAGDVAALAAYTGINYIKHFFTEPVTEETKILAVMRTAEEINPFVKAPFTILDTKNIDNGYRGK